jgi:outer membrane lipase/esterase
MHKTRFNPSTPASTRSAPSTRRSPARGPRFLLCLVSALLLTCGAGALRAQDARHLPDPDYTTIVIFGDSLSDTGNVAILTTDKYGIEIPGPIADYTAGRFTDGTDTLPPAESYFGVWVEQLAASFPSKPAVVPSLEGGTDYAYGFATTARGTGAFTFGPSDELSVNVDNIGKQITTYLATKPKITDKTLFVVWGGAIDLLYATSENDVIGAGINQTLNVERLIEAGATQIIVPNLPPLGLVPRLNGSPTTSVPATQESVLYNEVLDGGLLLLRLFNFDRRLDISELDVFALFNKIVASPTSYSLVNVTTSSQGIPVDPDTYLFWDDLHPTTRGHNILAVTAANMLAQSACRNELVAGGRGLPEARGGCEEAVAHEPAGATR